MKLLPEFESAEKALGSAVYSEPLCSLTGPIQRGTFTLLYGPRYCNMLAQKLCFAAMLPVREGGLSSRSVIVDAGNSFEFYYLSHLASKAGLEPKKALRGLTISRAFNCHQLANLLVNELPKAITRLNTGLAAVLGLTHSFGDSELNTKARKNMAKTLAETLSDIACRNQVVVVATVADNDPLTRIFLERADIAVRFRKMIIGNEIQATLARHPFAKRKTITMQQGEVRR